MEFAAFASFALLVVAWVVLPVRATTEPSVQADDAVPLAEPAAG